MIIEIAKPKLGGGEAILAALGEKNFMQKIVLTGPESTGKTTLAKQLAGHFGTLWVPEFAREYLEKLGRPYVENDLLEIAKGQRAQEDESEKRAKEILFLDTSLEVIQIWSKVVFGTCHPWITKQLKMRQPDLYILCRPDILWQPDALRENPNDRDVLFKIYQKELRALGANVAELNGQGEERFEKAVAIVKEFLTY